ncbi:uncharacterized protein TRIVIDRAFT_65898 [Trichoderma virens Gv29-8]|uniref:Uncharacterized protein n=1 Tax=Hypocrea virens (strain Gv29-8 / FGSC 10586) TaxID=413071 RepID=G9N7G5_HYPVG|nr:uncharacterized protein TRIVIDRAFT_65898 [Trichoderma virens Gv29-8]EHK16931.1 hypothetical protein TRIVIDRAFT_65898 [Trichoderma virens Gv29-8]
METTVSLPLAHSSFMPPRMAKMGGTWVRYSAIPARRSNNSMSRSLGPKHEHEQFLAGIPPSAPFSHTLRRGKRAYELQAIFIKSNSSTLGTLYFGVRYKYEWKEKRRQE